jgi:hypothetical protein
MRPGLQMRSQHIGPRLRIGVDRGIDRRDHQMHVHHRGDMAAKRGDGGRAEREIGDEMPVHHIDMDPIGPLRLDGLDLAPEIGEIG